jgi:hypothetical protein
MPRCNAWCKGRLKKCAAWAMPNGKCRVHGGLSRGPVTPEGLERSLQAAWRGRDTYLSLCRLGLRKRTSGRRKGLAWRTQTYWATRIRNVLGAPPELAAQVARELVEHHREKDFGERLKKRIEEIKAQPSFSNKEIKDE